MAEPRSKRGTKKQTEAPAVSLQVSLPGNPVLDIRVSVSSPKYPALDEEMQVCLIPSKDNICILRRERNRLTAEEVASPLVSLSDTLYDIVDRLEKKAADALSEPEDAP